MATERLKKKIGKGRHHSAIKRARQNIKRRARKQAAISAMKRAIKSVRAKPLKEVLAKAIPLIDKAASKGVIPAKRASRILSRLSKLVSSNTHA